MRADTAEPHGRDRVAQCNNGQLLWRPVNTPESSSTVPVDRNSERLENELGRRRRDHGNDARLGVVPVTLPGRFRDQSLGSLAAGETHRTDATAPFMHTIGSEVPPLASLTNSSSGNRMARFVVNGLLVVALLGALAVAVVGWNELPTAAIWGRSLIVAALIASVVICVLFFVPFEVRANFTDRKSVV